MSPWFTNTATMRSGKLKLQVLRLSRGLRLALVNDATLPLFEDPLQWSYFNCLNASVWYIFMFYKANPELKIAVSAIAGNFRLKATTSKKSNLGKTTPPAGSGCSTTDIKTLVEGWCIFVGQVNITVIPQQKAYEIFEWVFWIIAKNKLCHKHGTYTFCSAW